MHANLRLGEVSRSVVEAAQWAQALKRAGQLRMLSQRNVRLAKQSLAGVGNAATAEGRAMLVRSSDALAAIFDRLTAAYEHSLLVVMS